LYAKRAYINSLHRSYVCASLARHRGVFWFTTWDRNGWMYGDVMVVIPDYITCTTFFRASKFKVLYVVIVSFDEGVYVYI